MNIKNKKDKLSLLCIKSKYSNFEEGKIYEAISYAKQGNQCTNFKIQDEDGDLFTIADKYMLDKGPLQFGIVEKILDTFSIEKYKLSLVQTDVNGVVKFGVVNSYDGFFGVLSNVDLYNKQECATSVFDRTCKGLKYKYRNLDLEEEGVER